MIGRPPIDVAPGELFRIVLRGSLPIQYRFDFAPHISLYVRAPSITQSAMLLGGADDADSAMLVSCLWTHSRPAFACLEEAGALTENEARPICAAVWDALKRCAPTYYGSDVKAWERALTEGAHEPPNWAIMYTLGRSGGPESVRPDTWFGCPVSELSDGQLMCFGVCRATYIERVNEEYRQRAKR